VIVKAVLILQPGARFRIEAAFQLRDYPSARWILDAGLALSITYGRNAGRKKGAVTPDPGTLNVVLWTDSSIWSENCVFLIPNHLTEY
jgi:hypothetical protein